MSAPRMSDLLAFHGKPGWEIAGDPEKRLMRRIANAAGLKKYHATKPATPDRKRRRKAARATRRANRR